VEITETWFGTSGKMEDLFGGCYEVLVCHKRMKRYVTSGEGK